VQRWMASTFLRTEKRFNRFMGHRDLWALEAILTPAATASQKAGVVTSTQPPPATFNWRRDMLWSLETEKAALCYVPRRGVLSLDGLKGSQIG
jgi:hypothetical protein